jgi:hypothetical protein
MGGREPSEAPVPISDGELAAEDAAALPDREAMSSISGLFGSVDNFAMPINEAIAANIGSIDSIAIADADQIVIIEQADSD